MPTTRRTRRGRSRRPAAVPASAPTPSIRASQAEFTKPMPPILPIAAGAAIVGGVAYLLLRPSTSQAAPMPQQLPSGLPPTTQLPSSPLPSGYYPSGTGQNVGLTSGPNGADPSPSLVARLRGSDAAKRIFATQALAYSTRYTDAVPDGIEGPITDGIIQSTVGATSFAPQLYPAIRQALLAQPAASEMGMRILPYTLPNDLIKSVNQVAVSMDPQTPLLQVLPQVPNPAGQVMPFAGYSRIPSASPGNTVGQNPGYGVITDPYGLNLGIWQRFAGGGHYAPSGNVAADIGRNPIAGQTGPFFQGYPGADAMMRMGFSPPRPVGQAQSRPSK